MYNGDLFPVSTYAHSSEEYRKAIDELVAAENELLKGYPQIRALFDKYQSALRLLSLTLITVRNF